MKSIVMSHKIERDELLKVLTWDEVGTETVGSCRIRLIPVWKWLLRLDDKDGMAQEVTI